MVEIFKARSNILLRNGSRRRKWASAGGCNVPYAPPQDYKCFRSIFQVHAMFME